MTKRFDNLKELADYFREESRESKMIVLDETILSQRIIDNMDKRLGCKSFSLVVDPDKIPPDPTNELTFPATTPDRIAKTFLYLLEKDVTISFQLEKTDDSKEVLFAIDVDLGTWSFGDSFLEFFALSINDLKDFLSDQHLAYSTYAGVDEAALWYQAKLTLSDDSKNPLANVLELLKLDPITLTLEGEIGSTEDGPTLDLTARFELEPITLGDLITIKTPYVKVFGKYVPIDSGDDSGDDASAEKLIYVGNYVGADIDFGPSSEFSLQFQASIHRGEGSISLHVGPDPDHKDAGASIDNLHVLVGQDAADGFDGIFEGVQIAVDFLDDYLKKTIVFKSFDTSLFLKNGSIGFVSVTVGSPKQWSIFGGTLKMDFDLQWAISNPLGPNRHMWAYLNANLNVRGIPFTLEVDIPSMCISGEYKGSPLSLNLAKAVEKLTGNTIHPPEDLAHLTLTEFGFSADPQGKVYAFHLGGAADLNLFGTRVLSITDGKVDVELKYIPSEDALIKVNEAAHTDMTLKMQGIIGILGLDISVNATVSTSPDTDTEFEAHLVDQTVGSLITCLGRLVDPYFDLTLPAPWNALLDIKLDALTLRINVSKGIVYLTYDADIKFAFIDISKIGLIYQKAHTDDKTKLTTPSSTQLSLACSFFGQSYGDDNPMSWDPMNDPPPATPGSDAVFDLNYLGLGQHVSPETGDLETMTGIITAMQEAMVPVDSSTSSPAKLPGIHFDADSHWLIATRFSVCVVEIMAIFNDPNLYGLHISLSPSAGSLGGLEFEILYKKVTPTIGLYHLELTLPDAMRHLQFGEVEVTLPVVALDIYTNGDFRIDVGFPKGLDFSRSCSVQVFPFLGYGGFYFAKLSGATSRQVPKISNGSFDPVIEFGLALSIGVGKTIDEGPLHAGLYVTVVGILEGVLGFFHKESHTSTDEIYHRVQGTVAIVGKLYGKVDFKVIKVEVSVKAYAAATLLVESHEPIHISIRAGVSVKAKVKVLFVTIHFSFSMTVKASFTIGSATPTPWHVIEEDRPKGQARLSQQPTVRPIQRGLMLDSPDTLPPAASVRCLVNGPRRLASLQATFEAAAKGDDRTPLRVVFYPAFTQSAEPLLARGEAATDTSGDISAQIVLLPLIENVIPLDQKGSSLDAGDTQDSPENPLLKLPRHLLAWVIKTHLSGSFIDSPVVTAAELRSIYADLTSDDIEQTGFTYEKLTEFLNQNFTLHLEPRLTDQNERDKFSAAIFPILPALTMTAQGETPVDFNKQTPVDKEYEEKIDAYLRQLMVEYETSVEQDYDKKKKKDNGDQTGLAGSTDDGPDATATEENHRSMATVIFQEYFVMMARMAVQRAIDLLEEYPYKVPVSQETGRTLSLYEIANRFSTSETEHTTGKDETLESIAARFGVPISTVRKENASVADKSPTDPLPEGLELVLPIGALTEWTTSEGDALDSLAHRFKLDVGTIKELNPDLSDIEPDQRGRPGTRVLLQVRVTPESIVLANQDRKDILNTDSKTATMLQGVTYQTGSGDTFKKVADKFMEGKAGFLSNLLGENQGKPVLQTGTVLTFHEDDAGLTYTTHEHDTCELIAAFYLVRANAPDLFNLIENLAEVVTTILALNPPPADPTKTMGPDTPIQPGYNLTFTPPSGEQVSYITNQWDTPRLVAAYFLSPGAEVLIIREFAYALIDLNKLGDIDPTKELDSGIVLQIPTFSYRVNAGDSLARINHLFGIELDKLADISDLLAVHSVLDIPRFGHVISTGDSLKSIAASYNLSLEHLTAGIWSLEGLFAKDAEITIPRVPARHTTDLINDLVDHHKFDDTVAMVSRFLLHGLRLPLNTPNLAALTAADLHNAEISAVTETGPLYELIGQQFAPPDSLKKGYEIDLSNTGGLDGLYFCMDRYYAEKDSTAASLARRFALEGKEAELQEKLEELNPGIFPLTDPGWVNFPADTSLKELAINLTQGEVDQIHDLENATFTPDVEPPHRLPLFRNTPFRWALQKRIVWQAAVLPDGTCLADSAQHVTAPTIWPFQDNLKRRIDTLPDGTKLYELYELMVGTQEDSSSKLVADQCDCYLWGTLVDFKVQTIASADESGAMPNTYNLIGTDEGGRDTLQKVWDYLDDHPDADVSLQLLYKPSSVSADASGLCSDNIDKPEVFILRANLSTLSESGMAVVRARRGGAEPTGGQYDAKISDAADFLKLLWECSVVHGGGYYLNYLTNDKKGLPAHLFAQESEAELSLLILVKDAQSETKHPRIGKFHNCAVVGQNIDSSSSSIFVQPIVHIVVEGDSLESVKEALNTEYGLSLTAVTLAEANEDLKNLLQVGKKLDVEGTPYTIVYGDTLAGVAAAHDITVQDLVTTGTNRTQKILEPGALMQIRPGQLRQASTVPPGNVGYQLLRPDPDPGETPAANMDPVQYLNTLFQLLGCRIGENETFVSSPESLPAGPVDSEHDGTDGVRTVAIRNNGTGDQTWCYEKVLPIYRYVNDGIGSDIVSTDPNAALPPAVSNPYRGIRESSSEETDDLKVRLDFDFHDVYGNRTEPKKAVGPLDIPVGYFDDLVGLGSWPSVSAAYTVGWAGTEGRWIQIHLGFHVGRYVPGKETPYDNALKNSCADRVKYADILYQIWQPDLIFRLRTSLNQPKDPGPPPDDGYAPDTVTPPRKPYLLTYEQKLKMAGVAGSIYAFLTAARNLNAYQHPVQTGDTLAKIARDYATTVEALFKANADVHVTDFIHQPTLSIPTFYTIKSGDTINSIADQVSKDEIVEKNLNVRLNPGMDIVTPARTPYTLEKGLTLRQIASRNQAGAALVAKANPDIKLTKDTPLTMCGVTLTAGENDTLGTMVEHFADQDPQVLTTVADLGAANQDTPGLFDSGSEPRLAIKDYVIQKGDTLASLEQKYGFEPSDIIDNEENADLINLFATGTLLQRGAEDYTVQPGDTLNSVAQHHKISLDKLAAQNPDPELKEGAQLYIPDTVSLDEEAKVYPESTYMVGVDEMLTKIAGKYLDPDSGEAFTAFDLAEKNRYTPYLFEVGARIEVDGKTVVVVETDTFDTLCRRLSDPCGDAELKKLVDAIENRTDILQTGALFACPPIHAGTDSSLDDLQNTFGVTPLALVEANRSLHGLLRTGCELTYEGKTITIGDNDTLLTVINRFAELGVTVTLEDIATKAEFSSMKTLFAENAMMLPGPIVGSLAVQFADQPVNPEQIFPVTVELESARKLDLVDPDFQNTPSVYLAQTSIAPQTDPGAESKKQGRRLHEFAKAFEEAFDGLIKVCTGRHTASDETAGEKQIWAVDFRDGALSFDIAGNSDHDNNPEARYFALAPLSNKLVEQAVDIPPYVSGTGLVWSEAKTHNFAGVDMDVWAREFLSAVDMYLSPEYAVPLYNLPADGAGGDATDGASCYRRVVEKKGELAQWITKGLQVIFTDQEGGDLTDAREALKQRLLISLSNAYEIDTVVQIPVDTSSSDSNIKTAPRLSGKPVVIPQGKAAHSSAGDNDVKAPPYSLSTAKVPLVGSTTQGSNQGRSYLTFLVDAKKATAERDLKLALRYAINEMEHDIRSVEDISDYQASSWLTFILPIGGKADTGLAAEPPAGKSLADRAKIGQLDIPIPLRAYPTPPSLVEQSGTGETVNDTDPLRKIIEQLKSWTYSYTFDHESISQDTTYLKVVFRGTGTSGVSAVKPPTYNRLLFAALAQFISVYPAIKNDLSVLPDQVAGEKNPVALKAADAFADLVEKVSDAWSKDELLAEAPLPEKQVIYEYKADDQELTEGKLYLKGVYTTEASFAWPDIYALVWQEDGDQAGFVEIKLECISTQISPPEAVYAFPVGFKRVPISRYRYSFGSLRITELQSGEGSVLIKRNENLGESQGKQVVEDFIYQTPYVGFSNPFKPLLVHLEDVNIQEDGEELKTALENLFKYLLFENGSSQDGSINTKIACGYGYELAGSSTGQALSDESAQLKTLLPVRLIPRFDFQLSSDWSNQFAAELESVLTSWKKQASPASKNGRFYFDLCLYAGESGQVDQPMLEIRNLYFPVEAQGAYRPA